MCAFKDCAARYFVPSKYGNFLPPEHVRFICWADPVAEATVVGPLVAVPLGDSVSAMAENRLRDGGAIFCRTPSAITRRADEHFI